MLVLGPGSEAEMIACFLGAELASTRFGPAIRSAPDRIRPGRLPGSRRVPAGHGAGHGPLGTV